MTTLSTSTTKKPATSSHPSHSKIKSASQSDLIDTKTKSSYPRSHFEKGLYFKQIHNQNDALVEFLKATQENPRLVRGFYEQALIFRERGYLKLAESSLEQALAAKPEYSDARVLLATVRIQQGNVGGAVQELSRTLGLNIENERDAQRVNLPAVPIVLQSIHKAIPVAQVDKTFLVPSKASKSAHSQSTPLLARQPALDSAERAKPPENDVDKKTDNSKRYDIANLKDSFEAAVISPFTNRWRLFSLGNGKEAGHTEDSEAKSAESQTDQPKTLQKHAKRKHRKTRKSSQSDDTAGGTALESNKKTAVDIETAAGSKVTTDDAKAGVEANTDVATTDDGVAKTDKPKKRRFHFRRTPKDEGLASASESKSTTENNADDLGPLPEVLAQAKSDGHLEENTPDAASDGFKRSNDEGVQAKAGPELPQQQAPAENKLAFQLPNFEAAGRGWLNSFTQATSGTVSASGNPATVSRTTATVRQDNDSWAKKMRYLQEHGTSMLKDGEAFMFSEETGEGVLFLADGQVMRRTIAEPRDSQDVVRERRPDIIAPAEVLYNLSLLGKLMPKAENREQQMSQTESDQSGNPTLAPPTKGDFKVDDLMGNSQGFWGWLKNVLKL